MRLAPISVPQTLVIGALDATWAPPGRAYYNRAVTVGTEDVRVVDLPESGHFEMTLPSTTSWPLVIAELHETFRRLDALGARDPGAR